MAARQSELLMNFVCSAKARGIDISAVLVFATDEETKELAEGLGLAVFFDRVVSKQTASSILPWMQWLLTNAPSAPQTRTLGISPRKLLEVTAIRHSLQ